MTVERTEDAGIAGVLPITMGGRTYELRTLTLRESRSWKRALAESLARLEVVDAPTEGADLIERLICVGDEERFNVLVAYDVDETLGGRDRIDETMRDAELRVAVEAVLDAQAPFGSVDVRSVVAEFGRAAEAMGGLLRLLVGTSPQENSTSGPSSTGASVTPTSIAPGPSSSSSSDGPTPDSGSSGKPQSDVT